MERRKPSRVGAAWLLGASLAAVPATVLAQAPPPPAAEPEPIVAPAGGRTVVYSQDFFARYEVTTAEDMVRRLPGAAAVLESGQQQGRGFGSGGAQVLLNGRRMAGKQNDIVTALRRIRSASVERVELIRGTSAEIDVLSQGLVVNIVLREGASVGGEGNWEINIRANEDGWAGGDGLASYSSAWRSLSYVVGIERNLWSPPTLGPAQWTDMTRLEEYFDLAGRRIELRPQTWRRDHDKWIYTANLTYAFQDGAQARLNGFFQTLQISERGTTPFLRFDANGVGSVVATDLQFRDIDTRKQLEIGGDYERELGPGQFKGLFIVGRNWAPTFDLRDRNTAGVVRQNSRSRIKQATGEEIVRGSYTWPIFTGQQLELGAEAARNTLEQTTQPFFDLNGDGVAEAITTPNPEAKVRELRGELFANHNWTIGPKLTLESSMVAEFSRITSNYALTPSRKYMFLKPRADLRYSLTPADQIGVTVERTVSQLDFGNFVPVYEVLNDRLLAGNPRLAPEKTWKAEVRYEHRLASDGGVIELRAWYDDISDHIDRAVIGTDSQGRLIVTVANIGSARRYGAEIEGSVRLTWIGLRDAVFTVNYERATSSVVDPFTRRKRVMRGNFPWELDFSFRHDVTAWRLSYGFDYSVNGGHTVFSDLTFRDDFYVHGRWNAFIERQLRSNLAIRFEAWQIGGAEEKRVRTAYAINQIDGAPSRFERYLETRDTRYNIKLRGTF